MDHPVLADIHNTSCAFLYETPFLASARVMAMTETERAAYLVEARALGNTVLVTLNQGDRPEIRARPFDAWHNKHLAVKALQQIVDSGMTPIVVLTDQTYFAQDLESNVDRFYDCLESCAELVAPLCLGLIGMWEVEEIFGNDQLGLGARRELNHRIRSGTVEAGAPDLRIGVHSGEGVHAQDIPRSIGPSMSCLEARFGMTLDEMVLFVKANVRRMAGYAADGIVDPGHIVGVMEHSIPAVYKGQSWAPTRTRDKARVWGHQLISVGGAAFDWSGGA